MIQAPLSAYLELAQKYYQEDRLDIAMKVVQDAFHIVGWPTGGWSQFYNNLTCENDARDSASLHRVDELLSVEIDAEAPEHVYSSLMDAAIEARRFASTQLQVELKSPVLVTIFRSDAPIQFISGRYGYVSPKTELYKICLPWLYSESPNNALRVLKHEFVHVAIFELAGINAPKWLHEGLASYLEQKFDAESADLPVAREALRHGDASIAHVEDILNTPSLRTDKKSAVHTAYSVSSTFIAWWVDHYGLSSVRAVLVRLAEDEDAAHAIRKVTGVSLADMEHQWTKALTQSIDA